MPVRRLNHAVLCVRDVARSVAFCTAVFGFAVDAETPGRAAFLSADGALNDHDLALFTIGPGAPGPERGRVGLHHLAVGSSARTASWPAPPRLRTGHGALVGPSDHLVSKSLYAKDADGHGLEVVWRVPREDRPRDQGLAAPLPSTGRRPRTAGDPTAGPAQTGSVT